MTLFTIRIVAVGYCVVLYSMAFNSSIGEAKASEPLQSPHNIDRTLQEWTDIVQSESHNAITEDGRLCGVYSLAFVFQLVDRKYTILDIKRELQVTDKGISLGEMEGVANKMGVPMKVVQCNPSTVWQLPLPAIAQTKPIPKVNVNHFIILLNATQQSVVAADASNHTMISTNADQLAQALTGYFLVPDRESLIWKKVVYSWVIGGLFGLGIVVLFHGLYGKRKQRCHLASSNVIKAALIILAVAASGCGHSSSPVKHIKIANRVIDIGFMDIGEADITRKFTVENISNAPVELTLGPSSCGCVSTSIESGSILDGQKRCNVIFTIHGRGDRAGRVNESTIVGVKGYDEFICVTLKGVVEGLVATTQQYVIRPRNEDSENKWPPDLKLNLITPEHDTDFQIHDIVSYPGYLICHIQGSLIGEPNKQSGFFVREVSVPVELVAGTSGFATCELIVKYELSGRDRELRIPALVLPIPTDSSNNGSHT
jgi:hypothetical protein